MPEIGEVARIVHYIRQHLVGRTVHVIKAQHDENVFGKVGTSAAEFEKALAGKKIVDAAQQGKYFWMIMSSPPHPLMHFGMAGWFNIRNVETAYYKPTGKTPSTEWPPKYWKFTIETLEEPSKPVTEAAFVDYRRFARIRLVDCPAEGIRTISPLKENGPDPVIDTDIVTEEWLVSKCTAKRIPIKALLLDQANISGIGNWVGDEIMYDARIHPEQYSNTLSAAQLSALHKSILRVCNLAVSTLSDSRKFPETWLFKHRWGKGKKESPNKLPNGAKITFLTVGGRTSAVVPSVQKKTGKVAGDFKEEDKEDEEEDEEEEKEEEEEEDVEDEEPEKVAVKESVTKKRKAATKEEKEEKVEKDKEVKPKAEKKGKGKANGTAKQKAVEEQPSAKKRKSVKEEVAVEDEPKVKRRSTRRTG